MRYCNQYDRLKIICQLPMQNTSNRKLECSLNNKLVIFLAFLLFIIFRRNIFLSANRKIELQFEDEDQRQIE